MKKALMILLSGILIITGCIELSFKADKKIAQVVYQSSYKKTVIIDAGHGGADAGTIGIDGALEKNINLSIALDLYDYLMVSGINSVLIRSGDYELYKQNEPRNRSDLYNRMDFINSIPNSYGDIDIMSEARKTYYIETLKIRIEKILKSSLN